MVFLFEAVKHYLPQAILLAYDKDFIGLRPFAFVFCEEECRHSKTRRDVPQTSELSIIFLKISHKLS